MTTTTITWGCQCHFCGRQITRGKPTLIFAWDKPILLGVSHSTCCATKYSYSCFQTCPPYRVSSEQVTFLMHFYCMLHSLPGGSERNRELRWSLSRMLDRYPSVLKRPMPVLQRFIRDHHKWGFEWLYDGDLETDFLRFLGQVQRAVKEKPLDVKVDFRK